MSVPPHRSIKPGTLVSIVLKQDQRTGRQVQGSVGQVLTRHDHPRGIKVKLTDGRVGRVQKLVEPANSIPPTITSGPTQKKYYRTMADQNPWADSQDGNGQSQNQQSGYNQQRFYGDQPQQQPQQQQSYQQYQQPQSQHPSHSQYNQQPSGAEPHGQYGQSQQPDFNAWSDAPSSNPPLPARHPARAADQNPSIGIHRNDTDTLLASQEDRAEQVEYMQSYEAAADQSPDDRNRAQLEKEFPNVDGSLIAALYSDTQDLSATREMLQELARE